jgi:hypothetical protein
MSGSTPSYIINRGRIGKTIPCKGNANLLKGQTGDDYCVIPITAAVNTCASVPNCKGFSVTSNKAWNKLYPDAAQLIGTGDLTVNSEWDTFLQDASGSSDYTLNPGQVGSPITCPGSSYLISGVDGKTFCAVPQESAAKACSSIPGCNGYGLSTNSGWNKTYNNASQLFGSGSLNNNNEWFTYTRSSGPTGATGAVGPTGTTGTTGTTGSSGISTRTRNIIISIVVFVILLLVGIILYEVFAPNSFFNSKT